MINKKLALKIFEGFSIQRWTDLIRPFDFVEMDNAAEEMVLAYIIGKYEENKGVYIDWNWIIHASLFDLLKKIALCDIKAPIQQMLKKYVKASIGRNDISVHKLRSSFAMEFYKSQHNILVLQQRMGHKSMTATNIYARASEKEDEVRNSRNWRN